jgi:hypothetical protein
VVALAVLASINGLHNWYAYDDVSLILSNAAAHSLSALVHVWGQPYWPPGVGGALYRPLTSALWAVEWVVGQGSPLPFHIVNIVLYAGVSLSVYGLARRLVPPSAAVIAAALFAVHPAHVEVVANCVGQSELLATLAVTTATLVFLDSPSGGARSRWLIALLYAAGILSKESAIVLPALLLVAALTVVRDGRPWRAQLAAFRPLAFALLVAFVGCLTLRYAVIGTVLGDPGHPMLAGASLPTRLWTMLGVVTEWVRLLVWPAHLSISYNPPAIPIRSHPDGTALVGALMVAAVVWAVIVARRRAPAIAFGLGWTALALVPVSNLLFVTGVLLAERSLFLPSVGAALAVGGVVAIVGEWRGLRVVAAVCIAAGVWRSAIRQPIWHDDHTLFARGVIDAPRDYYTHYLWADQLFNEGRTDDAAREAGRSIDLSRGYPPALALLADVYARDGACDRAIPLWRRALRVMPWLVPPRVRLAACLVRTGEYADARAVAVEGIAHGETDPALRQTIVAADSAASRRP